MVNYVSAIVFVFLLGPGLLVAWALGDNARARGARRSWCGCLLDLFVASAIRLAAEWERAVVFRLGKLSGVKGPGLFLVIPLIDWVRTIDTRVQALEISRQQVITRDNVPVSIDGVLFFRVAEAAQAVIARAGLPLRGLPVRAHVAARRHRPDDPRRAALRARADRGRHRLPRREGHAAPGASTSSPSAWRTSTCRRS